MSERDDTASVSERDDTASVSGTSTIDEVARDARRWGALETMLFEQLGALARSAETPAAARAPLATWCHRHAWHAELWAARVPVIPQRPAVSDGADPEFVATTRRLIETEPSALVTTVLPTIVDEHLPAHRGRVDRRLDGPTARILDLVTADYVAELSELAAVLAV